MKNERKLIDILQRATNHFLVVALLSVGVLLSSSPAGAQPFAYVTNNISSGEVTVIDTETDTVVDTVGVGLFPSAIAITPDGSLAYVVNSGANTVSVIDTATAATVGGPIPVGVSPSAVAIANVPGIGTRAYVTNEGSDSVSVIDTDPASGTFNTVVATVVDPDMDIFFPQGLAITADESQVYVTNFGFFLAVIDTTSNTVVDTTEFIGDFFEGVAITPDGFAYVAGSATGKVHVIDTSTNTLVDTDPDLGGVQGIPVGSSPSGVAITPDGTLVYVANSGSGDVSVIDTSTNTLVDTDPDLGGVQDIPVGSSPSGVAIATPPDNADYQPPGWDKGEKKGWQGGDLPPGLANSHEVPGWDKGEKKGWQ